MIIRAELLFVHQWLVKSYFGGMSYELVLGRVLLSLSKMKDEGIPQMP